MRESELSRGARVGRYEILEKIGAGGMAEIYLGRVRGAGDKLVAIKRILPRVATDRQYVDMFLAEARLAATLRHPNIADVFDVGMDHASYYFAMEYVHGHDARRIRLDAESRNELVPINITLAIAAAMASALAYAHAKQGPHGPLQLVHRDVSPSNILVSYDGAIKLVDFGIARAETGTNVTRTRTGQVKGKVPYMSPEQCRARPMDARSDLFSLGTVLYELTTNQRPFDRDSEFETLEAIVRGRPEPPSTIVGDYMPGLEPIVMRLLANRPADRYQTAAVLLADVERLCNVRSVRTSSLTVSMYMRKLFAAESAAFARAASEYEVEVAAPSRQASEYEVEVVKRAESVGDDVPTTDHAPAFGRELPRDVQVTFRAQVSRHAIKRIDPDALATQPLPHVKRSVEDETVDEGRPFEEQTTASRADAFDPIAARCAELIAEHAPSVDDPLELAAPVINQLLGRARTAHSRGDHETAVLLVEIALAAERDEHAVIKVLAAHDALIGAVFAAFIGDVRRTPAVSQQLEDLGGISVDQRAAFLLSRIDGRLSVEELLSMSGMPARDANRHLVQLVLRGIVVLV